MVYKIFPEKSATLYSYYPTLNSGIDEILDFSTYFSIDGTYQVSRPIIKFPQDEINDIFNNKINGKEHDVYLRLFLANSSQLPLDYKIHCYPLSVDWNIGTGRFSNSPITIDGVSWQYNKGLNEGSQWFDISIPGTTGSYSSNVGGGLWYIDYNSTQSFNRVSNKDIELNVTSIVDEWYTGSIENYGFILKHEDKLEFNTSSYFELKYFSGNTHTIYPPCLEIKWDDYNYSSSLNVVNNQNIILTLENNISEYQQDSVQRFKINVRDKYPVRIFQTSSLYLDNKILPTSSYYQIKDLDTEEIIIDFDEKYTKISANNEGNYFDIYMNGLECSRYYKILIKTIINDSVLVLDDNYFFKVIP